MNGLESILRNDALAREIAERVPLLQRNVSTAAGGPESFNEGVAPSTAAAPAPIPSVSFIPTLDSDGEAADPKEAVDAVVGSAGSASRNATSPSPGRLTIRWRTTGSCSPSAASLESEPSCPT